MDSGFIDILKQLVSEQSNAALTDAKRCKALLADYTRNEYKKESRLLVQAVDAGVAKKIDGADADGLMACKKAQVRELEEDYGLAPAVAAGIVNAIALVLRGDTDVTVSPSVEKAVERPIGTNIVEKPRVVTSGQGSSTFTDPRDGQTYRTVKIGGLVWMAENLNYKTSGSWCYGDDESNGKKYGRLYTWDDAKAACPKGWHLPSREEWDGLVDMAGGKAVACRKLKSKTGWNDRKDGTSGNGTDEFGFSALPGGYRHSDGSFYAAGNYGYWWSATELGSGNAYYRVMRYGNDYVNVGYDGRSLGFSVRCVGVAQDCSVER